MDRRSPGPLRTSSRSGGPRGSRSGSACRASGEYPQLRLRLLKPEAHTNLAGPDGTLLAGQPASSPHQHVELGLVSLSIQCRSRPQAGVAGTWLSPTSTRLTVSIVRCRRRAGPALATANRRSPRRAEPARPAASTAGRTRGRGASVRLRARQQARRFVRGPSRPGTRGQSLCADGRTG
jgi:hypothetical protein